MNRWQPALASLGLGLATAAAYSDIVRVEITGDVEYNDFLTGTLAGVNDGDRVLLTFDVDSTIFSNNPSYPTRGYPILPPSFHLQIGSVNVPLLNPGAPAYFVIRNNDPGVDGFFFSTGTGFPQEVPVSIGLGNYGIAFLRTFDVGTMWNSLDILDALGSWAYEHMSSYNFGIQLGEFSAPLGIVYERISVTRYPPPCPGDVNGDSQVDLSDLAITLSNFGTSAVATTRDGDMDGDHDVDLSDLTVLLSAFGSTCL